MLPELDDMSNLSEWIRSFLKLFGNLGKQYERYFFNDRELVGQEKANLVISLDGLVGGLVLLRRYLTAETPSSFESLPNKHDFWFEIRTDGAGWRGRGKMSGKYTFTMTSFADWYNNVMMKKTEKMFRMYSHAMSDGQLSDEERDSLCRFVEMVIFDILVIERVLLTTDVDR